MCHSSAFLVTPDPSPPRRRERGRPACPKLRRKRLAALAAKRIDPTITVGGLALACNVSRRTIQLWRKQAASYPEALSLAL